MDLDGNVEQLMARYQAGDVTAARSLISHLSAPLHRFFLAQAASRADADDLLQETWLRIHRARHTYRACEPLLPWLYAIARRVRVDHYRRARRRNVHEQSFEESVTAAAEPVAEPGAVDELAELLAPLTPSERELIVMLKVAGMSLEEVARAASCSVGAVKQKVHRAYRKLRQLDAARAQQKRRSGALS